MQEEKILLIGAGGQVGTELTEALRAAYGAEQVLATDLKGNPGGIFEAGPYESLDAKNKDAIYDVVRRFKPTQVYHLVAMLSATAEKHPMAGWALNMDSLLSVLDIAAQEKISRVFWPSSIAVFGPTTPPEMTPQKTVMEPTTIYGISKQAGERLLEWYWLKHGVDSRSLRYPGLIGYKSAPGGGTTDYAVDIFHQALETGAYNCFLEADTALPMLYMPDAIRATLEIMATDAENIKERGSYNLSGMSFSPAEIAQSIKNELPEFEMGYAVDPLKQKIADSWPKSIDDAAAQKDWGWKTQYDLQGMTQDMLTQLRAIKNIPA